MCNVVENFVCAPVLLIGFNRPDFMARQVEVLKKILPPKVYVAVDGPRNDVDGESGLCKSVRDCVKLIDWKCDVRTLFRKENRGCKYGVSEAISWFFENEESGIILEDDCSPDISFFRFATELLEKYRDNQTIGAICGFNFFNLQSDKETSYRFSRHMGVWGWASWRRVWDDYDVEIAQKIEKTSALIENSHMTSYNKKVYRKFAASLNNGFSTWDVQLSLLFLEKKYLTVIPRERLIHNTGIADFRASHTGGYIFWYKEWLQIGRLTFPLKHPEEIVCDKESDLLHEKMFSAFVPRAFTWVGCKIPILIGLIDSIGNVLRKYVPSLFRL